MAQPSRIESSLETFTPDSDGDFQLNNVFSQGIAPGGDGYVLASPTNGQVITVRAELTGNNQISGRAMRASGGEILPSTQQVTIAFLGVFYDD